MRTGQIAMINCVGLALGCDVDAAHIATFTVDVTDASIPAAIAHDTEIPTFVQGTGISIAVSGTAHTFFADRFDRRYRRDDHHGDRIDHHAGDAPLSRQRDGGRLRDVDDGDRTGHRRNRGALGADSDGARREPREPQRG